jgi:hypothetical protein
MEQAGTWWCINHVYGISGSLAINSLPALDGIGWIISTAGQVLQRTSRLMDDAGVGLQVSVHAAIKGSGINDPKNWGDFS